MGNKGLFGFYSQIGDYVHPDDGVPGAKFHYVIVGSGGLCGIVMAITFSLVIFGLWPEGKPFPPRYLQTPFIFFAMGAIFGVATTCTFAPSRFLKGPAGRKWLKFIGTEKLWVARAVCATLAMLFLAFIALTVWAAWSDMRKGML